LVDILEFLTGWGTEKGQSRLLECQLTQRALDRVDICPCGIAEPYFPYDCKVEAQISSKSVECNTTNAFRI
jgi:hypothetical protein